STTDPREVPTHYREFRPDLIMLDLRMPHLDGVQVLERLKRETSGEIYLPVLVLTADAAPEAKRRALAAGASDFVTKPFDRIELLLRVDNLLAMRFLHRELRRQNEDLEAQVRERTHQLLETEKLATMGNLLAGVAHELNSPLSVILGHVALFAASAADDGARARAQGIGDAAERCVRIVRSFLTMARRHPPERAHVSVNQVLKDAVELLAYELRVANVDVRVDLPDDLPLVWADGHQLRQVAVNLIANARQAMLDTPPPRRLSLAARSDDSSRSVRVEIADTGPGIPQEIQARIFEPFFTTKSEGEGTGLGLALTRGIIEGHGGTIRVESRPGRRSGAREARGAALRPDHQRQRHASDERPRALPRSGTARAAPGPAVRLRDRRHPQSEDPGVPRTDRSAAAREAVHARRRQAGGSTRPPGSRTRLGLLDHAPLQAPEQVEDAEALAAAPDHVTVRGLTPP